MLTPKKAGQLVLDTPAGKVIAGYKMDGEYVESVTLKNVLSCLFAADVGIEITELGRRCVDVSYGGNVYVSIEHQGKYRDLDQRKVD